MEGDDSSAGNVVSNQDEVSSSSKSSESFEVTTSSDGSVFREESSEGTDGGGGLTIGGGGMTSGSRGMTSESIGMTSDNGKKTSEGVTSESSGDVTIASSGQDISEGETEGKRKEADSKETIATIEQTSLAGTSGDKKEEAKREEETCVEEEEEEEVFEYDYEQMKSTPTMVNVSTSNMLQLHHSYGYECQKRFNLVVLAKDVVGYAAGNLVVVLDLNSHSQTCLRTLGGGGIGAITVHPSSKFFAVGEKGTNPVICIYTYPDLTLHRILRGGTETVYSHINFSPEEGSLLASVGGTPDFMLTIWDWSKEKVLLRSKAFSQDVYRVTFSPDNPQQLTTSGTGHIRFWKMARTFTGLKLQGQLGKFGHIEISDISAYVELPDGKVMSGTEWGNFLLWDGGFIKVELSKRGKKFCHNGMIEVIYLDEGELISAGADGYIRVWDFESIDSADISDENCTFEIAPMIEIKVGNDVSLKSLVRSIDPDTPTLWYGQDASGAIWKIDIIVSHTRRAPEKLVSFHSGEITGLDCSPVSHQAASIAQNGSVYVYDLPSKSVVCHREFPSGGSSLTWAPTTVDQDAVTIITGFTDGVIRVLKLEESVSSLPKSRSDNQFLNLVHVCKPHNQAVISLAVDPEGNILASGGKDGVIFFLDIKEEYSPIGFIRAPSHVTAVCWSPWPKFKLLVCCEDGSMMEVEAPIKGLRNISKTYHLDSLGFSSLKFAPIKDRLRADEEETGRIAEKKRKDEEREERNRKRRELLEDAYVSDDEEEEEEEKEKGVVGGDEEKKEEQKPKGPSSILAAFYEKDDEGRKYWVAMDGYDAGYLYRFSMEEAGPHFDPYESTCTIPVPALPGALPDNDVPIQSLTFSSSGEYFLMGTSNGYIRVHPLHSPHNLCDLSSYWVMPMHDYHYGAINHLCISLDDHFVVSGGADGNIFAYVADLPSTTRMREAKTIKVPAPSEKSVTDIDSSKHYSIEDARQKAEHDRLVTHTEGKKKLARQEIANLRHAFTKLKEENKRLPYHLQLGPEEFIMDPGMEKTLQMKTLEKVELVHREMSWEAERHRLALGKLKTKFKAMVECERITLWSFTGHYQVSSFKYAGPSQTFLDCIDRQMTSKDTSRYGGFTATPNEITEALDPTRTSISGEEQAKGREGETEELVMDADMEVTKEAIRRMRRLQRLKEHEEHEARKPDEKSDDPADAASYREAKNNIGDYKLKTAEDFIVSEEERVTTEKKRKELLLLRKKIFDTKKQYNEQLCELRDRKLQTVDKGKADSVMREWEGVVSTRSTRNVRAPKEKKEFIIHTPTYELMLQAMTPTQRLIYQEQQLLHVYQRDSYLTHIDKLQADFDEVLLRLLHEKIHLDIVVVTADLGHITLFEEMTLLKEFEKRETTFTTKYRTKKLGKQAMAIKIEEIQWAMSANEKQLSCLQEQERPLVQTFNEAIGDNKFKDFLTKVFRKKIRRAKKLERKGVKKEGSGEGEGDSEEDEEEEDDSDEELSSTGEDTDKEDSLDDSVCPPSCDLSLFNMAVQLREKRLDLEEMEAEAKRSLDMQRKELDGMRKKAKSMESQVNTARQELQAFQLKKQHRLNELDQVVVLGLHQLLHCHENGEPPSSIASCLVFSASVLHQLGQRIEELGHEKQQEKKVYRELKQSFKKLGRENKEMMAYLFAMRAQVNEAMLLKFGQVVDLKKLEVLQSNPVLDEKRAQIRSLEMEGMKEIVLVKEKVEQKRRELMGVVQNNTVRLKRMYELLTLEREISRRLDARQKSMSKEMSGSDTHWSTEERERLHEIVRMQTVDIQSMREEIEELMLKDQHIMPPSQPFLPTLQSKQMVEF